MEHIYPVLVVEFIDKFTNTGDGKLWADTWGRDIHYHPLLLRQGQGLEQGTGTLQ